jgi:photosystem II stability/assembly factor-like uncharacterized protein
MSVLKKLVLVVSLFFAGPAFAVPQLTELNSPAIIIRNPAQALLVSITNAGARLVAVGGHGLIIYSDDNGRTWRQASVPTSETITCVAFADAKNGWAAGGQGVVLHSTDGGESWHLQLTGDQVIKLMTASANEFAAVHPTDDAAQRALRRSGIFTDAGPDKPFLTILAVNPQTAIIFGAYRMTVFTTDGGKNWVDWSLNVGDPISHNIYAVAQIGPAIYLAGETGVVLRSDDQGQHFSMLTSPDPSTLFGILGTHKGTILTFGVAGEVFRSTDQGVSWAESNIAASSDLTGGLVLQSGNILTVSEDGGVFESKDDGLTFQNIAVNNGMAPFALTQAANGDIVFVGSGGVRVEPGSMFN